MYIYNSKLFKLIITACLFIFIIFMILEIFEVYRKKDYQYKIDFFKYYLKNYYTLNDTIITDFVDVLEMLNENEKIIAENISPLEILAIGIKETNFKNVKGDGDDSLGFFQVQEPTYWFIKNKYNYLYLKIKYYGLPWIWNNVRIRPDAQLLTSILYLYYLKDRFSVDYAYSHYNGGNAYYQVDIISILSKLEKEYRIYKRNKELKYND